MAFALTDLKVRMPVVGLIARDAKNFQPGRDGWLNAEEKLCATYKRYISQLQRDKFLQRIEYMKHAGDLGRTPMSKGLTVFLFLLVAAEAMGFSYLLGTWAAADGSPALYRQLMYGIVIVLASILALVTHAAGAQVYRTKLIRSCYARYKEGDSKDFHSTRVISLADDQYADKNEPPETRCMNRIINSPHDMGSYLWAWVAGSFVVAIFIGSGAMRFYHMEADKTRQSQAQAQPTNPFARADMPSELTGPQQATDRKAQGEVATDTRIEGGSAILILGFIFVVTQIVGFGAGHKHCFAGKETYKTAAGSNASWWWSQKDGAYAETWGYATYEAYWEAMQPYKDVVNTRLKELQQRLRHNSPKNLSLTKTFDDYLDLQAQIAQRSIQAHNAPVGSAPSAPEASQPMAFHTSGTAQATPAAPAFTSIQITAEQAKRELDEIVDRSEQQAYFVKLPSDLREMLKPWLKERKERTAAVVSQAELDDLF